jgi:hypothetical protein
MVWRNQKPKEIALNMGASLELRTYYRLAVVAFAYVVLLAATVGANPFKGESLAPMDLLLSYPGWEAIGWEGTVRHHERSDVLDGRIPMWKKVKSGLRNQDSGMWDIVGAYGQPGTLNLVNSIFTPSFLMFLVFDDDALGFYFAMLINLLIAGLGTYCLLRLYVAGFAAWFGGAVFCIVGFNAAYLYWPHVTTACWIPWLLWAISGWTLHRRPVWTLAIAGSTAMLLLGGFPVVAAYGLYSGVLLALILLLFVQRPVISRVKVGLVTLSSILIGFGLAAVPLLGLHEMLSLQDLSYRRGRGLDFGSEWMLIFNPYLHGLPRVGSTVYSGLIATAMALAVIPLLAFRRLQDRKKTGLAVFSLLALAGSLILAFGLLPIEMSSRIPAIGTSKLTRLFVITGLSIALLSAVFFDYFSAQIREIGPISLRTTAMALLVGLITAQLLDQASLFRRFNSVASESQFLPSTPSIDYLRDNLQGMQSVIADRSFLISGTLGSYGIPEWFTHGFRNEEEKLTLSKLVTDPFRTATAAMFSGASIQWGSPLMDKLGIAYALVGRSDLEEFSFEAVRTQPMGNHKAAPPLPANTLEQEITIHRQKTIHAIGLRLGTYRQASAPADVKLTLTDSQNRILASSVIDAAAVLDNKESKFQFSGPVELEPGRYRIRLELVDTNVEGRLTVWWVRPPEHPGDVILINGRPRPGAMAYTLYSAKVFDTRIWDVFQHEDEPSTLLLKNREVPTGAYFLPKLTEDANWSDRQVVTEIIDNQNIEISYAGSEQGYIVLPTRAYPGWIMTHDGAQMEPERFLGMLPAVPVSGPASLRYIYRPGWLGKGMIITAIALLALIAQFALLRRLA